MTEVKERRYTVATFFTPGLLFSENTPIVVQDCEPEVVAKMAPKYAFSFLLQAYVEKTTTVDGEQFTKTETVGEPSGRYYLGGTVYTLEELKARFGNDGSMRTLIRNIECNGYAKAIKCHTGNWQPFEDKDVLLACAA